jgi:hypothetical protein
MSYKLQRHYEELKLVIFNYVRQNIFQPITNIFIINVEVGDKEDFTEMPIMTTPNTNSNSILTTGIWTSMWPVLCLITKHERGFHP